MTHEDYVSFEQAKALKELGFDWECQAYFEDYVDELNRHHRKFRFNAVANDMLHKDFCSAPTLAQAAKWLREVKCIIVHVFIDDNSDEPWSYEILSTKRDEDGDWVYLVPQWDANFYSKEPEQALSAGIDRAIQILTAQNK